MSRRRRKTARGRKNKNSPQGKTQKRGGGGGWMDQATGERKRKNRNIDWKADGGGTVSSSQICSDEVVRVLIQCGGMPRRKSIQLVRNLVS